MFYLANMAKKKRPEDKIKTGRPRTVSPPPDECIRLGQEMVQWVKQNHPTHLSEWFSIQKMIPWKMWNTMCETSEFLPYYEISLSMVAENCRNGTLNPSIAQRFLSLYHRDLKREERETVEHASKQKSINESQLPKNDDIISSLLAEIKSLKLKINAS